MLAGAVLAVPLFGSGVANAAMAGANPLTTTTRPDLRTVTLTSETSARFCFDKNVTQTPDPARFILGGYRWDNQLASTAAPTISGSCVDATFPTFLGEDDDLAQYSYGQVSEGGAQRAVGATLVNNRADSTGLAGSTSHNGTRGLTTAPDLQAVAITNVGGPNELTYTYDQKVQASTVCATCFYFYDAAGAFHASATAQASGNVVRAQFALPNGVTTSNAVRAGNFGGPLNGQPTALFSQTHLHTPATQEGIAVAGGSGDTPRPDLLSATLSIDGTFVDYTFDRPVAPGLVERFAVYQSDGDALNNGAFAAQPSPNTVRVNYSASLSQTFHEYFVKAAVYEGAATEVGGPNAGAGNTNGSTPVGGNAGAFASGFATGPDAFRVTFDTAGNTATVLFDQRVFCGPANTASSFVLLDGDGNPLPGGTGQAASCAALASPPVAGAFNVTVTFTGASVANAKAVEIRGPAETGQPTAAVRTSLAKPPGGGAPNVQQIVSPTATALVRRHGRVVWARAHTSRRANRAAAARFYRSRRSL